MTDEGKYFDEDLFQSRVRGCILGGAIGDALGAPVEFMPLSLIDEIAGMAPVFDYLPTQYGPDLGLITDDTQMTLWTVEGLIRGSVHKGGMLGDDKFPMSVQQSYLRWLATQVDGNVDGIAKDGWLYQEPWLHARRAPGNTCMAGLYEFDGEHFGRAARNNMSKGCGGVMRSAPFGLMVGHRDGYTPEWCFETAVKCAAYTHGHPTAQVSSGALAIIVAYLVEGVDLYRAVELALTYVLEQEEDGLETGYALQAALEMARREPCSREVLATLGQGWVADEALAISVYAALSYSAKEHFLDALGLAVSHSGDSDSTGAITGNILGAFHGEDWLPPGLTATVEGKESITTLADDFVVECRWSEKAPSVEWLAIYPGVQLRAICE